MPKTIGIIDADLLDNVVAGAADAVHDGHFSASAAVCTAASIVS